MRFETKLIHAGEEKKIDGAVTLPIFRSSTYEESEGLAYDDIRYGRLSNSPNHFSLAQKLAAIEGGEAGLPTSSGMAAISTTLLALVGEGDHLIAQSDLYGGTVSFLREDFAKMGRRVSFFSVDDFSSVRSLLRPETRAIYVEGASNPLLNVPDLRGVVDFAKSAGILSLIDSTMITPINLNPLSLSFDLVLHSATKYLNGHTDAIAGAVVGSKVLVDKIAHVLNHLGGCLDPQACALVIRGMKTLSLRVKAQNQSALSLATELEKHPKVTRVFYPGLPSHPHHVRACELLKGFGGMLAFEMAGSGSETEAMIRRLKIGVVAPSFGGPETIVTRPSASSHRGMSAEERLKVGIRDNLVRVSVGLEDVEDLKEDFHKALGR